MTVTTAPQLVQFSEYLLKPFDRRRTELVNGQMIEMAEVSPLHVLIIKRLQQMLDEHIKEITSELDTYSGCGVQIPRTDRESNVRDPDLVVCSTAQFQEMLGLTKAIFLEGNPPALAIEVASPSDTSRDTVNKRIEYALAKIPEYWIVNPVDGVVLTMVLDGDQYRELGESEGSDPIVSELFPKFSPMASVLLSGNVNKQQKVNK